jgi:hypothetical protein
MADWVVQAGGAAWAGGADWEQAWLAMETASSAGK